MNRDWYEYCVSRLDLPSDIKAEVFYWTFSRLWRKNHQGYEIISIDSCIYNWIKNHLNFQKRANGIITRFPYQTVALSMAGKGTFEGLKWWIMMTSRRSKIKNIIRLN